MNEDYLIDLLVEAILSDICKRTDEWADPTGDKAVQLSDINTSYNRKEILIMTTKNLIIIEAIFMTGTIVVGTILLRRL